jgi:type I restriction enzyme M protein
MNMIMHDVHYKRFDIKNEDTLERPLHLDMRFEAIVANPPFSANWSASPLFMNDDRFSGYGNSLHLVKLILPLCNTWYTNWMITELWQLFPHGFVSWRCRRSHTPVFNKEKNYLDAVLVCLPIFYGTSIPTCILVLKKKRTDAKIFCLDASQHFEKVKPKRIA